MSDKNKELQSPDSSSNEAIRRAERIKAIKSSLNKGSNQDEKSVSNTDKEIPVETATAEKTPEASVNKTAENTQSNWEDELAARIAKRVQNVKKTKSASYTPESILDELDGLIASNEAVLNGEEEAEEDISQQESQTDMSEEETAEENSEECVQDVVDDTPDDEAADEAATEKTKKKKTKKSKKKKQKKTLKEGLLGLLPQKKDSVGEKVRKVVFLGSVAAIIICGYVVADYYIDIYSTEKDYKEIMVNYPDNSSIPEKKADDDDDGEIYTLLPGAEKLLAMNNEVVGVINIPGTEVNYPVVQSDDLVKYLNKNVMGEEARAGAIFLDYRNRFDHVVDGKITEENSDNLIIYGHNMESGMMFGTLKQYRNNVHYYGEHPIIELNSNYARYQYKIFAFFIVDAEDKTDTAFECWNQLNFADETEFYDFVNEAKRRTIRLNDVDVEYGDKILTLSTCNGIFGKDGPGRLMVMARLVREGEDPYEGTQNSTANPNIKWPTLYYRYNKNEKYDPDAEFVPYGSEAQEETTAEE